MGRLQYHALGTDNYSQSRYDFLKKVEGSEALSYRDSAGIPTIGVGFNLRVPKIWMLFLLYSASTRIMEIYPPRLRQGRVTIVTISEAL